MRRTSAQGGTNEERLVLGIAAVIAGMAFMTIMDAFAKWLGAGYPIGQVVFFRTLFSLIPVAVIIWQSGGPATLRTRRPGLHLLRALSALTAMFCFFFALRFMALADAVAVAFVAPLLVTGLSMPLLGERVGPRRWAAVFVGFLGAMIVVRPGGETFQWAALLPAVAALGYAFVVLVGRRLSRHESIASILFYSTTINTVLAGLTLPFAWKTPPLGDFALFLAMGLIGGFGMYFLTLAYRHAAAAVLAPFEYTALLWGVLIGWLLWSELPDLWVWVGAAVVVASGLYILYRERRVGPAPQTAAGSRSRG
jgi:drug/metabolite transporter (DMT)-like permease